MENDIQFKGSLLREEGTFLKQWTQRAALLDVGKLHFYDTRIEKKYHLGEFNLEGHTVELGSPETRIKLKKGGRETTFIAACDAEKHSVHDWLRAINFHIQYANNGHFPPLTQIVTPKTKTNEQLDSNRVPCLPALTPAEGAASTITPSPSAPTFIYPGGAIATLTPAEPFQSSTHTIPNSVTTPISTGSTTTTQATNSSSQRNYPYPQLYESQPSQAPQPVRQFADPTKIQHGHHHHHPESIPNIKTNSRDWFNYFDKNQSGTLCKYETAVALSKTFPNLDLDSAHSVLEALWCLFDSDSSGFIDVHEFSKPQGLAEMILYQMQPSSPPVAPAYMMPHTAVAIPVQDHVMSATIPFNSRTDPYNYTHSSKSHQIPSQDYNYQHSTHTNHAALPFNWEECIAPDGRKYYVNYVTRETTWIRPV